MWYRIDFTRFVQQLLPPILRSKVMMALFRVFITPLRYLYDKFLAYRDNVSSRLNITANVQYIQKALNDAFYLTDNQIYIETPEDERTPSFYFQNEGQPAIYFYMAGSKPFYLRSPDDVPQSETYIIFIPTFLCTSLDTTEDKYKGENLQIIYNILNNYKPAGRMYCIEIYDYE
ncbi:MAG: hypothetical protein Q4F44_01705 [Bacteroidales bacterium]|nr:hypothetical protein [Bacteroidales bacterium]